MRQPPGFGGPRDSTKCKKKKASKTTYEEATTTASSRAGTDGQRPKQGVDKTGSVNQGRAGTTVYNVEAIGMNHTLTLFYSPTQYRTDMRHIPPKWVQ